ncbi:hypothetical protein [Aggregatilinea lenta]|uniref:hypothetical protein n=1 Tax=Aggregatilinea lenta TaxID=913108 RepID=UPI000E5A802E|nr:hypothetical protein [Aggregatilinea lenta]
MSGHTEIKFGFAVEVVQGDALAFPADVLAVKYAPNSSGLDAQVLKRLGVPEAERPASGEYRLLPSENTLASPQVVVVGTGAVKTLHYAQLRALGHSFLRSLWRESVPCGHLATTVHGVRTGLSLDEVEAFRSLLLGFADAYEAGEYPSDLARITIVEQNEYRAQVFRAALDEFLVAQPVAPEEAAPIAPQAAMRSPVEAPITAPSVPPPADFEAEAPELKIIAPQPRVISGADSFMPEFRVAEATATTPHIFVAMPFKDDYDDQFYLAIQPCIKDRGYLCERMDLDHFTGDIIDRMFERIRTARLVVALLDGGNPNVFLEVGYAWGVNTSTVLIAREGELLPFDIKTQRVLMYEKIHKLKDMLAGELDKLLPNLDRSHG